MATTKPATMTRAQRDMALKIAAEVIELARTGAVTLDASTYLFRPLSPDVAQTLRVAAETPGDALYADLQPHVAAVLGRRCEVCHLGLCMLAKAKLFDRVPLRTLGLSVHNRLSAVRDDLVAALVDVWPARQLDLMECAFERDAGFGYAATVRHKKDAAVFGARYDDHVDRAVAIMENVLAHDGAFVPPRRLHD